MLVTTIPKITPTKHSTGLCPSLSLRLVLAILFTTLAILLLSYRIPIESYIIIREKNMVMANNIPVLP